MCTPTHPLHPHSEGQKNLLEKVTTPRKGAMLASLRHALDVLQHQGWPPQAAQVQQLFDQPD